jgi:hypothetical protein
MRKALGDALKRRLAADLSKRQRCRSVWCQTSITADSNSSSATVFDVDDNDDHMHYHPKAEKYRIIY